MGPNEKQPDVPQGNAPEKKYDYNAEVNKTSVELAKMILTKLEAEKGFLIVEDDQKLDPIRRAAFIEKSTDTSIDILQEIAKSDIPHLYATRCIDKIEKVLGVLKQYIQGTINQNLDEIISRTLATRDVEKNVFVSGQSSVGNILLKLDEIRKATGNDPYDYYERSPEEQKVNGQTIAPDTEAKPSPYVPE